MGRKMLKSKIHRATVTGADLHYEGSITFDKNLMLPTRSEEAGQGALKKVAW